MSPDSYSRQYKDLPINWNREFLFCDFSTIVVVFYNFTGITYDRGRVSMEVERSKGRAVTKGS